MKYIFNLIIFTTLLVSCSTAPSDESIQTAIAETQIVIPTNGIELSATTIPTQEPSLTHAISLPVRNTPTKTLFPSVTITPTKDLSLFNIDPCFPKNTLVQKGIVEQVIDGDTIYVRLDDGNTYRVRYIGIDAPERERPFYLDSYNANSDLVLKKEVVLIKDVSETDRYDRLLRYVIVDNVFVNLEMVRLGYAIAETYPPDIACADTLSSIQIETRASQFGIWEATLTPEPSSAQVIIVTVNKRDEFVDIKNMGNNDVDLAGWNLVSERGNQDCPLSGIIIAGQTLRIWAMTAQGPGYSCGYSTNIWNNSEPDPAVLYNSQGVEVSRK